MCSQNFGSVMAASSFEVPDRTEKLALRRNSVSLTCDDVTAWRNSVSVTCNDVSAKRTDTSSRREHVSLVVGFWCLDLGLGSSIWVREKVGPASGRNAVASTRSAKITVSICEVPDRTVNLPSGRREAVSVRLSAEPRMSCSIIPPARRVTA
jgi:hypothetical protein